MCQTSIFINRERQKQLDELSKELARVTDETETLKAALRTKAKGKVEENNREPS